MNLEKLKDTARKFEQKEDWRKAIDVYLKALQQIESGGESSPDLSLYNRVGDLYLKINDTAAAVRSYERAVDLYADQGFFNNAIALCGKILRVNPGRTSTYLKLAQLHARKNVVVEAKRNLLEFLERMNGLGQLDQAFQSVKEFADQFSGSQEIRLMLVELLRAASREDEAREQLEKLAGALEGQGDHVAAQQAWEQAQAVAADEEAVPPSRRRGDLVFLDTGVAGASAAPVTSAPAGPRTPEPPADLELTRPLQPATAGVGGVADPVEPLLEASGSALAAEPVREPTPGLDPPDSILDLSMEVPGYGVPDAADLPTEEPEPPAPEPTAHAEAYGDLPIVPLDLEGEGTTGLELEPTRFEEPDGTAFETAGDLGLGLADDQSGLGPAGEFAPVDPIDLEPADEARSPGELPFLQLQEPPASSLAELEDRVLDDPEDPEPHRELAEALLAAEEPERAIEEFDLALDGYARREDWSAAAAVVDRVLALEPDSIRHHQKRVELAYRMGERRPLVEAYLALGDALARAGATAKAVAVFRRVQEHDPGNPRAEAVLRALDPPALPPPPVPPTVPPAPRPGRAATPPAATPARVQTAAEHSEEFVDLGSMVLEQQGPKDTRMRVDRREPTQADEQREFQEILAQFKRGIEENLEDDDYQAHYDLGVAFKEMGLLDEAIAEFQKALRAPEGRLRTSEALGIAFYEKGQYAVAESILRRAVDTLDGGDEEKVGLIYWLGRATEAQGRDADAISSYERVMTVDIRFMDLGERIRRLSAGQHR